jgi:Tol biopolymer transport system component
MTDATAQALIRAQVALESFRLAPDGASIVYVLRRVVRDEYESHLWTRPLRGGRPRQLTRGRVRDGAPAISPDGRRVAFVRSPVGDDKAVAQAWILPLDGGEPWQLTTLKHGVASAHWSPDGQRLALLAQAGDHRFVIGEGRQGRSPTARRLTRLDFRDDESGHVVRRAHLWVMPPRAGARPHQLTSGDFDVLNPAWSPDGTRIAFAADRGADATINPRTQIWSVGTTATRPRIRELASLAGDADRAVGHGPAVRCATMPDNGPRPPDRRVGVVRPAHPRRGARPGVARRLVAGGDRR